MATFGCVDSASALGTVNAKECPGCSATAMQAMAKNTMPLGLNFVYDLPAHVMRKYEVYLDSTCGPTPVIKSGAGGGGQTEGNGTDCTSFKAADLMTPVDATVQATFDALYSVYTHNPTLATQGKTTRVSLLPVDSVTGQPFDPRYVAWDYPQQSYIRFYNYVQNQIGTRAGANALNGSLGDDIYGWSIASVNVGPILGADPAVSFSLSWDRSTTTHFEWCVPPDLDCVEFTITRAPNGSVSLVFNGVLDFDQNHYPSASGTPPGNLNGFGFPHHGGDHFAGGMEHGSGIQVPDQPECGYAMHPFMTTMRDASGHFWGAVYSCVPN